jgi:hypothetical protein
METAVIINTVTVSRVKQNSKNAHIVTNKFSNRTVIAPPAPSTSKSVLNSLVLPECCLLSLEEPHVESHSDSLCTTAISVGVLENTGEDPDFGATSTIESDCRSFSRIIIKRSSKVHLEVCFQKEDKKEAGAGGGSGCYNVFPKFTGVRLRGEWDTCLLEE